MTSCCCPSGGRMVNRGCLFAAPSSACCIQSLQHASIWHLLQTDINVYLSVWARRVTGSTSCFAGRSAESDSSDSSALLALSGVSGFPRDRMEGNCKLHVVLHFGSFWGTVTYIISACKYAPQHAMAGGTHNMHWQRTRAMPEMGIWVTTLERLIAAAASVIISGHFIAAAPPRIPHPVNWPHHSVRGK